MARKVQTGHGTFIKHTNKKRPGRHSKDQTKEIEENHIMDKGENNDVLYLAYFNRIIICSFFIFYGV
jgi:hypothetical protein